MASPRRVPTSITSPARLIAALQALGFEEVERFETPQPLLSWRGQPLDALAEIIVRRKQIGITADDFGFVRGTSGAYEAFVSDILLSRFDRRWFVKLHELAESLAPAAGPATTPRAAPEASAGSASQPVATPVRPAPREASPPRAAPSRGALPEQVLEAAPLSAPSPAPLSAPAEAPIPMGETMRRALEELSASLQTPVEKPLSALDVEREVSDLLAASLSAGQSSKACLPFLFALFFIGAVAIATQSGKVLLIGGFILFALFSKVATKRIRRIADAAAIQFRARFQDPELRARALKLMVAGRSKQSSEMRQVIDVLVDRLHK